MLSISAMSGGQAEYYSALAREDYYFEGGEPPGHWLGIGAQRLGLPDEVEKSDLQRLFSGLGSHGQPLVQNALQVNRQPGWDLTFSAPKSVSVLWSQAPQELRAEIQAAHQAAVKAALDYLEAEAAFSRIGKGGQGVVPAGLVVASFEHGTSRALDPQLHTHALVLNVGVAADGSTRTILSKPLYQHKMVAGALYRAELAHQLFQTLGLRSVREGSWFELAVVPKELIRHFSKRRQAIEEELQSTGLESASAAALAALKTRQIKQVVPPRGELFDRWQAELQASGLSLPLIETRPCSEPVSERLAAAALRAALLTLSQSESHFSRKQILTEAFREACGRGVSAAAMRAAVAQATSNPQQLMSLATPDGEQRFTTPELVKLERRLLSAAHDLSQSAYRPASEEQLTLAIERKRLANEKISQVPIAKLAQRIQRAISPDAFTLSAEQAAALRHLTQAPGRLKVLSGLAGTGKTTLLQAAREVWEHEGFRVLGTALSAVAAKKLEEGSGIKSDTLAKTLLRLYPTQQAIWQHHGKQLWRAVRGKPTYALDELTLDRKTVLVLDEAGMVGTRDFELLTRAVARAGAVLLLVGDARQLPAIEAGGAFQAIGKLVGQAELNEITRQRSLEDRQVVKALADGDADTALKEYLKRGQLTIAETPQAAREQLIADWTSAGAPLQPERFAILGATNDEVQELNQLAQRERLRQEVLNGGKYVELEGTHFHVGDRVICRKNSRPLGVRNGDVGTIISLSSFGHSPAVTLLLDGAKTPTTLPVRDYSQLALGYAFTTHKLQGATVEHTLVQLSGRMTSREMTYVQASRHKESIRLYADASEAGQRLTSLARQGDAASTNAEVLAQALQESPLWRKMNTSVSKTLAHEQAWLEARPQTLSPRLS